MKHQLIILILLLIACFGSGCTQTKSVDNSNETEQLFKAGILILVGPENYNSSFSYYNTTPESPDGSKISYVKFLDTPREDRSEKVPAELWVCDNDLSNHQKVINLKDLAVHNGARAQWIDNHTIAYQDDSIRVVNLDGEALVKAVSGRIGHAPYNGKILYAAYAPETNYSTIYEYNIKKDTIQELANVINFGDLEKKFPDEKLIPVSEWRILHLQYNQNGSKIAFRLDVGPRNEKYKHLVSMDLNGDNVHFFGSKPMHFYWYDNDTFMGHDHQVNDGMPDNKTLRRWDQDGKFIENLAGVGNHLGAAYDRQLFASESWYQEVPVILSTFKKGKTEAFWQDTVSQDKHTTWELAYHTNPAFSRDGKRVYFNNCTAPGKVQAYMVVLSEKSDESIN